MGYFDFPVALLYPQGRGDYCDASNLISNFKKAFKASITTKDEWQPFEAVAV